MPSPGCCIGAYIAGTGSCFFAFGVLFFAVANDMRKPAEMALAWRYLIVGLLAGGAGLAGILAGCAIACTNDDHYDGLQPGLESPHRPERDDDEHAP